MTKDQAEVTARVATEIYGLTGVEVYEPVSIPKEPDYYSVVRYPDKFDYYNRYYDEYGYEHEFVKEYATSIPLAFSILKEKSILDKLSNITCDYSTTEKTWQVGVFTNNNRYYIKNGKELALTVCEALLDINRNHIVLSQPENN